MKARVISLDADGNGTIGTPPGRYAGTDTDMPVTISNMSRDLTVGLIDDQNQEQLVNGDITVTGGSPGGEVRVFLRHPPN